MLKMYTEEVSIGACLRSFHSKTGQIDTQCFFASFSACTYRSWKQMLKTQIDELYNEAIQF